MSDFFEDSNAWEITRGNLFAPDFELFYTARQQDAKNWTDDIDSGDSITDLMILYDTDEL